jgi:hypothetical protein
VDAAAGPLFPKSVDLARDALAVLYDGRLFELPDQAVTVWICGTTDGFLKLIGERAPNVHDLPYGAYDATRREIFVNTATAGIFTLTHELMHPLLQSDFPRAPTWLVEGMASLFEKPDLKSEPGQIHGLPDQRRGDLLAALASPGGAARITVPALFALTEDAFRVRSLEVEHYAAARELMRWMDARGWLWRFYTGWRDAVLDDPTGERTFTRVTGSTLADATAPWLAWVKASAPP